ncbi:restriction endonuclease subunit S [Vibrio vulnificus]|uniref:restriction endonuclease subunit S n=1 Tax=Vibrio vulnificus TaxID=672 RepID=UPI001A2BB1FB|nr:restriction endonuclease subunit S [Vibrio vulnificus]HAS6054581.1 restriction endonuclease subunit S [Vibrio vulnificus]
MCDLPTVKVSECCDILDNLRIPLNAEEREKIKGNIPYCGANGIQGYISEYIFDEDLILLAEDGGNFDEYQTRPIAYRISGKSWVNNHAHVLRAKEGYDFSFVFYSLQHKNIIPFIKGGTRAKLNQAELREITIWDAPLPIQQRIGEIIETIDNQIDATQALIDKYTAIKQGMMADLFSRGIDPETKALRPTFEEAPELYHKTPLGMLPKEWDVKTLGDISEKITSGSRDWAKFYSSEGDLFVRISNLTREHVNFRWNSVKYVNIGGGSEGERTQLQPGDILVSITADLGIVGVVPEDMGRAYINQHTALIRLATDGENARFIGNYLSSRRGQEQFEKNNDSGAKAGINLPTIASLRCPTPEGKEQILIASKIDALDEVIADLKREKSKSLSLKQGLMQDLLTGKVSVPA